MDLKKGRKCDVARIKGENINRNHLLFHNDICLDSVSCAAIDIGEFTYNFYSTLAYTNKCTHLWFMPMTNTQ
jgi:hypothetical protein